MMVVAGLGLSGAVPALAQTPAPAPQVAVSGVVYAQYLYQLKDSAGAGNQNQFSVQRAYLNVIGKFADGITTRLTTDITPTGAPGASQVVRLKYAYVAWQPGATGPLTYKLGLIHTPWLDWEEALWDYRMQGAMATDRNKFLTSADFGAGVDGNWSDNAVNGQLTVVNGEGYSGGTGDKRKDVQARVSVRVMPTDDNSRVGGLRISGYAGIGKATGGGDRNRFMGMLSYRSKMLTLAGEFMSAKDTVSPAGGGPNATGRIISAFGVLHIPNSAAAIIARVDNLDPNTSVTNDKQTLIIGGVSYQVSPNLRTLLDLQNLSFENSAIAKQSQALFQIQFTF